MVRERVEDEFRECRVEVLGNRGAREQFVIRDFRRTRLVITA